MLVMYRFPSKKEQKARTVLLPPEGSSPKSDGPKNHLSDPDPIQPKMNLISSIIAITLVSLYISGIETSSGPARCHSNYEYKLTNDLGIDDDYSDDDALDGLWSWVKRKWDQCASGQLRQRGNYLLEDYEDFCKTQFMIELRLLQDVRACHGLVNETLRIDLRSFLPFKPEPDDRELWRVIRRYRQIFNRNKTMTDAYDDDDDDDDQVVGEFRNSFIARTFARHKLHGACGLSKEGLIDQYTDRSLSELDTSARRTSSSVRNNLAEAGVRIVGGREVRRGEVPFQVRLANVQWFAEFTTCGGSLIDDRHILTAAHCVYSSRYKPSKLKVYVGDRNQFEPDGEKDYQIESVTVHPNYRPSGFNWDIAVLKTRNRITSKQGLIERICLAQDRDSARPERGPYYVSGWGFTKSHSGIATILRIVDVRVKRCPSRYAMNICTSTYGKDSCTGDSGGPLFKKSSMPGCSFEQLGLVSYGPENCGSGDSDAYYSSVSFFYDWIMEAIR